MKKDFKRPKPIVLLVIDGLGVASPNCGNAVTLANTPNLDSYWFKYPHCYLHASGNSVGLPSGVVGNSEVGHMGLAAGKVVFQEIARINRDIEQKTFFQNETFLKAIAHVKKHNSKFHLMGLTSDGNVHSSMGHLEACIEFCKKEGIPGQNVFVHCFTDGRDTPPKSAELYLKQIEDFCNSKGTGRIASVMGRYYAMDRDNRWERTQRAYEAIVQGKGTLVTHWSEAIKQSYQNEITDEYIKPHVIAENSTPIGTVSQNDVVLFFNYRPDRAVQISKAFEKDNFTHWQRPKLKNVFFVGFSNYQKGIVMNRAKEDVEEAGSEREMVQKYFKEELKRGEKRFPKYQIFPPERVPLSLGRIIADAGYRQLRISESEKYPHVTYFFNCREKVVFQGEDRVEIESPRNVTTYDQIPEMSTYKITKKVTQAIDQGIYDFILVNFANTDMVAHTGNLQASIRAVEIADECTSKIVKKVLSKGGEIIITADHGNIEELINLQTGNVDTEHSTNLVPFLYLSNKLKNRELQLGILADITPTILTSLGIQVPSAMTGRNLLS